MRKQATQRQQVAWLRRLPGSVREAAGVERVILRRLPSATLAASALVACCAAVTMALQDTAASPVQDRLASDVLILSVALLATLWTAAFTLAIGCAIVVVMKGPGYVADAYPLADADHPTTREHE